MASKIWPAFMVEPEVVREREAEEWARIADEWEAEDHRRANNEDPYAYFDERSPA